MFRVTAAGRWLYAHTFGLMQRGLTRLAYIFDESESSKTAGARNFRRILAIGFGAYAVQLEVTGVLHGDVPLTPILVGMLAFAVFIGRGGRFLYYFVPFCLGLLSYIMAGQIVSGYKLPVHYLPQIRVEEWLTPGGSIPSVWLQHQLYQGHTGPLEVFSVLMYVSHFWVPLVLGGAFVLTGRGVAFGRMMFGILTALVLGEATFILFPTAPPWLASQHGYLPHVHHMLKNSLYDLHLTQLADLLGDPHKYDVTAAVPSLHVAFPLICIFAAVRYGMPRWVTIALAVNTLGVVFAIVYMGEHYLVDGLAGAVYAVAAWTLVQRLHRRSDARVLKPGLPAADAPDPVGVTARAR
jgi:hypothetical protein